MHRFRTTFAVLNTTLLGLGIFASYLLNKSGEEVLLTLSSVAASISIALAWYLALTKRQRIPVILKILAIILFVVGLAPLILLALLFTGISQGAPLP